MSEEVARLRTAVGAKVLSINLLLAMHTSESISRVEVQSRTSHATLLASILDLRSQAACANTTLRTTKGLVNGIAKEQKRHGRYMKRTLDDAAGTLRNVSESTAAMNATVMGFRDLGTQLLQLVSALPRQVRETLEQVVKSNLEMYAMLRNIQTSLSRSPGYSSADTFRFEDVLGRSRTLPYEYFRHIDVFRAFLRTEFRGLPGEQQVLTKQYTIMDTRNDDVSIEDDAWGVVVFPGATLVMTVLVEILMANRKTAANCPRLTCTGQGRLQQTQSRFLIW